MGVVDGVREWFGEHWVDSNPVHWRVGGFFVAVFAVGGLAGIITSTAGLIRVGGEGEMVDTTATVVRVREPYDVRVRFIHVDGEPRTAHLSAWHRGGLRNPAGQPYRRGETLSIYYDPAEPAQVFQGTARDFVGQLPLMLAGVVVLAVAIGLGGYGYRRYRTRQYSLS